MIAFLHPWVLAGLAAASIPLLLHLIARREPPTVIFPAVRYLIDTTREHDRRLKLRNLLLLLVRTLLIILVVLAAAGPTSPLKGTGAHAPAALALVLDNSLSSGAVIDGTPRLADLKAAARRVLDQAGTGDDLWLLAADGIPRKGSARELKLMVDSLRPVSRRMDLGDAVLSAQGIIEAQDLPGEIILITDLQASAVSPAGLSVPLLVARPGEGEIANTGIDSVSTGVQPWSGDGGQILVTVGSTLDEPVPLVAHLGEQPPRQAIVSAGSPSAVNFGDTPPGWWTLRVELDPDELLADNVWYDAVRIAPPASVAWDPESRFISTAAEVLAANGRIRKGGEISLGGLERGLSVVVPPEDPARLGALNRRLAARGVGWQFGTLDTLPVSVDSGGPAEGEEIRQRYELVPTGSGRTGVISTAGGEPWIVRGNGVVVLGSRLDPYWTTLPVSASFVPFLDGLLNRIARGQIAHVRGEVGDRVRLPDVVTEVLSQDRSWKVEGGAAFVPPETGVYYLSNGSDTVGVLAVNHDPRETRLDRADDSAVRSLWQGASVVSLDEIAGRAFAQGARADLRGPLIWAAVLMALAETVLASGRRRTR